MGKKKRSYPDIEEVLGRPWCYYCERDFEDLKLLISHQKAKHFKCDRCGRRLNTAGGLSVHMNQVHKESLSHVENALPNRQGLEVEIFGMEGIPQEILEQHRNRIIQNFYQAQEDRRIATGNVQPGQSENHARKKIRVESADELKKRLAEHVARLKAQKASGANGASGAAPPGDFSQYPPGQQDFGQPGFAQPPGSFPPSYAAGSSLPARPNAGLPPPAGLPQRPGYPDSFPPGAVSSEAAGDDIDQLIRMAEAGIRPPRKDDGAPADDAPGKKSKKDKDKNSKMVYSDTDISPEEKIATLGRYAFVPAA